MVSFIILNFNNQEDTFVCVDSIKQACEDKEYSIVVVDNGSIQECVDALKTKYDNDDKVCLVLNGENLGFARGNNVGCKVAIEQFNPDFLYVINNDTKIYDKDTITKIYQIYEEKKFDILGPRIYDIVLQSELNPNKVQKDFAQVKAHYKKLKCARWALHFGSLAHRATYVFYGKIFKKSNYSAFGLCGAALIFSKQYFERFQDVFVSKTFFYGEEHYLKYREQKYDLVVIYDDRLYIEHFGSSSTKKLNKDKKKFYKFKIDAKIASIEQLIDSYENDLDE